MAVVKEERQEEDIHLLHGVFRLKATRQEKIKELMT
jgi:hypothetical protein